MTMITPSYLGETIEYSSLHACRSTLEDPTSPYLSEMARGRPEIARGRPMAAARRRKGRVERGLDLELRNSPWVGAAERAALRAQARAVDLAGAGEPPDPDVISRASRAYLEIRQGAQLTASRSAGRPAKDPWQELARGLTVPELGD